MRHPSILVAVAAALVAQLLFVQDAEAQRSSFKVTEIKAKGETYQVTLATNHYGDPTDANFFAHTKTPGHSSTEVSRGVPLGTFTTPTGAGSVTFTMTKAQMDQLGLTAGKTLHVAATWPKFGHNWGTDNTAGSAHWDGTSLKIPAAKPQPAARPAEAAETFPLGMPLSYEKPLWKGAKPGQNGKRAVKGVPLNPLAGPADIAGLPNAARDFASAGSMLESEGKVGIKNKQQLRRTEAILKKMANDPKLAAKILGPGWSISRGAVYSFSDQYKDNKELTLAKTEGGLRVREVKGSGQPAQLNFKDPGGVRGGPNKVVMSRTERFTTLGPNPDLKAVVRSDSILNPMRNVKLAGEDPASYLKDAADVPDRRARFQLMYKNPGSRGKPQAVAEISVDHVYAFKAKMGNPKHKQVTFFGMEVDIAHQPVNGSGKSVDYIPGVKNWQAPHKPSDVKHLEKDASIQKTYEAIGKLTDHLANNGVQLRPTAPKYTEGMIRSGVIQPSTKRTDNFQKTVLRRDASSFLPAKNPVNRGPATRSAPVRAGRSK